MFKWIIICYIVTTAGTQSLNFHFNLPGCIFAISVMSI